MLDTTAERYEPLNSEIRDGMRIDWDVPIKMDDGIVLRADVFRPIKDGRYPGLITYGPYGKGLSFQQGYPIQWERLVLEHPDVAAGSTNKYQNWETVDPEKWVPDSYVCIRVDSRGAGRSPGYIDPWSPRETKDFHDCIEWAAQQAWSNSKIGINGISYYAANQWHVAATKPPHLVAMCAWEGCSDYYRDQVRHGGILTTMQINWFPRQVAKVQHGLGDRGARSVVTGELVCGPETLSEDELKRNRCDLEHDIVSRPLDSGFYRERSQQWNKIVTPFLSAANWGGQGLHTRGNFLNFTESASREKWLEVHGLEHWTEFYTDYGVNLQKRFFGHYLKGEDTGWRKQPRVQLRVRHVDHFVDRAENEWPLARTQWTKFYLHSDGLLSTLAPSESGTTAYDGLGDGATFLTAPLRDETEITGPSAARLFVSSSTTDADLFLVLRILTPDLKEIVFQGALDPHTPIGQGWLRASHRKLDRKHSKPYLPYHTHDEPLPLVPGEPVAVDVELWPTSIVVPAGYRIALTVRGKDYVYPGASSEPVSNMKNAFTGCGPFLHDHPDDRPADIFGGTVTLHIDSKNPAYVLLPIVPKD
jgi:predicted acyl esterase